MKTVKIILACIIFLSLSLPALKAEISEGIMAELFNGLADIIERNMNNPSQGITQLQEFIAANKMAFMEWKRTVEENMDKAMADPQAMPGQEDWQKMQDMMGNSQGALAINRWTQSIMNFMMRNPRIADQLQQIMEDVSPRPPEYR